jgi:hypothetical protein
MIGMPVQRPSVRSSSLRNSPIRGKIHRLNQIGVLKQFPLNFVQLVVGHAHGRKYRQTVFVAILPNDDVSAAQILKIVGESAEGSDGGVGIPARLVFDAVPLDRALPEQVFDVDRKFAGRLHGPLFFEFCAESIFLG